MYWVYPAYIGTTPMTWNRQHAYRELCFVSPGNLSISSGDISLKRGDVM